MLDFLMLEKVAYENITKFSKKDCGWAEVLEQRFDGKFILQLVQVYSKRLDCIYYEVIVSIDGCHFYEINLENTLQRCYNRFNKLLKLMNNGRDISKYTAKKDRKRIT